ncbi:hypothetical protein A5904_13235 [Acidithiobacillus caldus]|uniref:Uncharacterized protein n=3 Tax=Acidithiobacillus caldus TaxID=33059 RepID=F9ZTN7_ACICS|nr:conserved hypothetical protein [Acidithiobacillus caldus SM-1]AIA56426.1 hypothetical protein Acaty_c2582 [Acidithiobacillus caldus ATCC 51756]AUW33756.1 hypothetical protein A5904_13235 [Acidithiobacillus caldus]MBU2729485.1 hypothetical protein [Acidithiobacillus caldus]MBU2734493.1 hypothetical protein [Acidithiobacillus caldus ATCC 51756]
MLLRGEHHAMLRERSPRIAERWPPRQPVSLLQRLFRWEQSDDEFQWTSPVPAAAGNTGACAAL